MCTSTQGVWQPTWLCVCVCVRVIDKKMRRVKHSYAFGNTEEKARRLNMGCKARGQPGQPFSHKTGHGYVKAHRGFYHDAIFVKRNNILQPAASRDVRRRLLAHRRSQAATPRAQSRARQR